MYNDQIIHRLKKLQNCFCQNFVKFPPILIIFDRKIAEAKIMRDALISHLT